MGNGDLISRDVLNEMVDDLCSGFGRETEVEGGVLIDRVAALPAVDAEVVRHGRWEAVENTGLEEWCAPPIRCSSCCKTMPDVGADFCPFCGQMNAEVEGC